MNISNALKVIDQVAERNRANSNDKFKTEYNMRLRVSDLRAVVIALGEPEETERQRLARLQREGCGIKPDPIKEVYEKYRNMDYVSHHQNMWNSFEVELWNVIKQHCENK